MEATTTKTIGIVVLGAGEETAEVRDTTIFPGSTVRDVLETCHLSGYRLSKGKGQPFLDPQDEIFSLVQDGAKLYASTPADQGR